jgi:hypothetical protein
MMLWDAHTLSPFTQSHYNLLNETTKYTTKNYWPLSMHYDISDTIYKAMSIPPGSSLTTQTSSTLP